MRILLSGSSGFIGSHVRSHFEGKGYCVVCLKKGDPGLSDETVVFFNPDTGTFLKEPFEGFDAVIHLAGEPIAGRWNFKKKQKILFSRTIGTLLLSHILSQAIRPPKVFISASATGYYGDRKEERLTETSPPGEGFLTAVCCEWEKACRTIQERGARVVNTRFAPVLGQGGVLKKMIPLFRWGLGGKLGSGNQWMSWVCLPDLIRAVDFCLHTDSLQGPVNVVSPNPVRQKQFSSTLASMLHRPTFFHQPAWLLRIILGEIADGAILSSQRVFPEKLLSAGFTFDFPFLKDALEECLNFERKDV